MLAKARKVFSSTEAYTRKKGKRKKKEALPHKIGIPLRSVGGRLLCCVHVRRLCVIRACMHDFMVTLRRKRERDLCIIVITIRVYFDLRHAAFREGKKMVNGGSRSFIIGWFSCSLRACMRDPWVLALPSQNFFRG